MKSTNKFAMKKFLFAGLTFFAIILIGFLYAYFLQLGIEKIGYVKVLNNKNRNILYGTTFEGRLVDSKGNDKLLFKFKTSNAEIDQKLTFFPHRFFSWGKNHVAYTQNLKEVILVDYKTGREVYKQKLNEGIEFINVNKAKEEFVIATEKALYILKYRKKQENDKKSPFILKRVAEGKFWFPSISIDSRYIVCGEIASNNILATSLVLFDLLNNTKKKLISEKLGNLPLTQDYRLIYSTAISNDNKWVVISTSSSGTPPYRYLTAINLKSGLVKEFGSNTGLCNSPGCFVSSDKYMFTQGEPEYREFGDYSPIIEPFRSKPVIVDLNTGKLEIVNNVPKDTNIYWPIYKNDKTIYFIDRKYYSFVPNKIFDTNIYRLKNKKFELLFQIKGGIVSYDVISK
ncbi:hypothetical protein Csac_1496 [Caldicellulosiruptor saccharolyticus DSM 8903]|uniref:Uncharacterized protein n=1 Tax=Caldicellulosiruptor saccharolyticus (strain ATCC 43494 / DSM 8903 / Tp8T 6331) TaxID=351627 RepID=A4XJK4_CALS8|nr:MULTISPECIES: hypothetical protein [Clostridia]ABP67089.1 hypothetical protein Csac_1496 [Caldicellulosiruptor saccharolyticus DSM 8903]HBW60767.1 hypothetical protein [Thermoanaerobacter sp.]